MSISSIQSKYPSAIWFDSNHGGTNSGTVDNPYTSMSTAIGAITSNDNVIAVLNGTHNVAQADLGGSGSASTITLGGTANKLTFVGESTNAIISTTGVNHGTALNLQAKSYDCHLESIKFYQDSGTAHYSTIAVPTNLTAEDCVFEMGSSSLSVATNRGMFVGNSGNTATIDIKRSVIITTANGNNTYFGSVLGGQQLGFGSATIEHCTIKTQGSNQLISFYSGSGKPNPLNFKNNIIVGSGNQYITHNNTYGPSTGITHNCYHNTATTSANARDVAGAVFADPQFVDETNGDYRLRPTSPCISAGTAS
jgi:hypothetical protein